jgi:hypothetical protein
MLRQDVALEDIEAVLRHRSIETTRTSVATWWLSPPTSGAATHANSYWYLEATPALFSKIAERCEDFAKGGNS